MDKRKEPERLICAFRYNAREEETYERKVVKKVREQDADGFLRTREVRITDIELRLIEIITMRLIADHERYFAVEELPFGYKQMKLEVFVSTNDESLNGQD